MQNKSSIRWGQSRVCRKGIQNTLLSQTRSIESQFAIISLFSNAYRDSLDTIYGAP
uniref:Uncharacterized protein n=1 Tax=Moniliophthora roreri TaxID=221103 RepID=A0A0W0GBU4_MONRR